MRNDRAAHRPRPEVALDPGRARGLGARPVDPIVGVVLAAARVAKRGEATPPEVLRYWTWFLDGARREVHQNEREFVRRASAAGRPDDQIRRWVLLDPGAELDQYVADLGAPVHRTERPPPGQPVRGRLVVAVVVPRGHAVRR